MSRVTTDETENWGTVPFLEYLQHWFVFMIFADLESRNGTQTCWIWNWRTVSKFERIGPRTRELQIISGWHHTVDEATSWKAVVLPCRQSSFGISAATWKGYVWVALAAQRPSRLRCNPRCTFSQFFFDLLRDALCRFNIHDQLCVQLYVQVIGECVPKKGLGSRPRYKQVRQCGTR